MKTSLSILFLLRITVSGDDLVRKKVCVIGAGPSGLASVRQLSKWPQQFEPVVFEKNSDVGGQWLYSDSGDLDEHGLPVHSGMYKNLRTNLPKETMTYPDFLNTTFKESRSSVRHDTILDYLQKYTLHFNLRKYIQFDTLVEKVSPIIECNDWRTTKWLVETKNLSTNENFESICDAVMVCSGDTMISPFSPCKVYRKQNRLTFVTQRISSNCVYNIRIDEMSFEFLYQPKIPEIPGMADFKGKVLHSHSYRRPEDFTNQVVVILGAGPSGTDIATELSEYAKVVYLSHRHEKLEGKIPKNLVQVKGIVKANNNSLILQDNTTITADSFIYCTGYKTVFPFLDKHSGIEITDNYVHPLYKQIVNVEHPTMSFIGLPIFVVSMALYDRQAKYFVALLQGHVNLPKRDEMLESSKLPSGVPAKDAHFLFKKQWDYMSDLAKGGGFEDLPDFYERAFTAWVSFQFSHIWNYKDGDLRFLEDGQAVIVPHLKEA